MEIETFATARLQLRKFTPEVYAHLFQHFSPAEVKSIIRLETDEQYQKLRQKHEGGLASYNRSLVSFQLVETLSQTVLGSCGFHNWFPDHQRAELGYHLEHEAFKNRGFMKEALAFVIPYGFETMNLHRIEALVSPTNEPSLKLIRYFGLQPEGLLKEHYWNEGRFDDSLIFGLLKKEYQQQVS